MIIPEKIKILIAKELRGTLVPEERLLLNRWYDNQYRDTFSKEKSPELPPRNFKRLEKEMDIPSTDATNRVWVGVAAACIVFILGFYIQYTDLPENIATPENEEMLYETIQNDRGIRRSVTLADGSRIYLNSNSTIEIHKRFSTNRTVRLIGEAYFEVAKDSLHPFVVHTQDLETRVLGTAFSVQAFNNKPQLIAVKEGRVNVKHVAVDAPGEYLTKNEQLVVTAEATFGEITKIDPQLVFAWVEGTIVFDRTPLRVVLKELSEWYGLETLKAENINKNCKVTGTYTKMKLIDILESIKYATGIAYELNGKQLTVKNGDC